MQEKECICCGKIKPITEFYRNRKMKDGHLNKCMECVKKYEQEKYTQDKKKKQMKVKFVRYNEAAKMPKKAYESDFCYDVYAVSEQEIAPNVWKYGLGFGLQIDRGSASQISEEIVEMGGVHGNKKGISFNYSPINLSIDLRSRSSISETGMILTNGVGTIDEGYTGEITAIFYHVIPSLPRYKVGQRIGQIKLGIAFPMNFIEVEELRGTERGGHGNGSTGKE